MTADGLQLYDAQGRRKYLTAEERRAFLKAAGDADRGVRTLCLTLAYTGCRISEALTIQLNAEFRCVRCGKKEHADAGAARSLRIRRSEPVLRDPGRPRQQVLTELQRRGLHIASSAQRRTGRTVGCLAASVRSGGERVAEHYGTTSGRR